MMFKLSDKQECPACSEATVLCRLPAAFLSPKTEAQTRTAPRGLANPVTTSATSTHKAANTTTTTTTTATPQLTGALWAAAACEWHVLWLRRLRPASGSALKHVRCHVCYLFVTQARPKGALAPGGTIHAKARHPSLASVDKVIQRFRICGN
jgi:hypothetical protein